MYRESKECKTGQPEQFCHYDYVNVIGVDIVTEMKVINVKQRRDYFTSLLMFTSIQCIAPDYLCNEITMAAEVSDRLTRHENDVVILFMLRIIILVIKECSLDTRPIITPSCRRGSCGIRGSKNPSGGASNFTTVRTEYVMSLY